jgi:alanyl-tRNA synthetase
LVFILQDFVFPQENRTFAVEKLKSEKNMSKEINIYDTKRENNLIVHLSNSLPDDVTGKFVAKIDVEKRRRAECNHTATHLLHEALREVFGKHVEQKGSFVSPEMLRFDFSHFQKLTQEEIRRVEHLANEKIRANYPLVEHRDTPIAEAQAMGAMALFGEKYGETVRVVRFGDSIELCGGTHVRSTGEIGMVRIVSESSIAAGVRRIEAITGEAVENLLDTVQDTVSSLKDFFNNTPNLLSAVRKTIEENAELKKQVDDYVQKQLAELAEKLLEKNDVTKIPFDLGYHFDEWDVKVIKFVTKISAEQAKTLAFKLRERRSEKLFVVIGSVFDGKPSLTVMLSDDLVQAGLNAVNIIREAAKAIQGGGGGQPFFAQAGGKNAEGIDRAVEIATKL